MTLSLLIPLGLLGLLGIVALIIIYIIKPNYQVKHVSSTYVWRLSLKYRRKKLPTSKIRNLLLFLCQILILTAIALILAKPALVYDHNSDLSDAIAIIDSSASMYAGDENETRFERAVKLVADQTNRIVDAGGAMSVILADGDPDFLGRRVTTRNKSTLTDALSDLLDDEEACYYGSSDVTSAIKLTEDVLAENPAAKIFLYTDVSYTVVPENVEVVSVAEEGEWNAAILDATAELVDGYYSVTARVACYGRALALGVTVQVTGANAGVNDAGDTLEFTKTVDCTNDEVKTVTFRYGGGDEGGNNFYYDVGDENRFRSYKDINVFVNEDDSFREDNSFNLYGGTKELIELQYASSDPNPFFTSGIDVLCNAFAASWDVRVTLVPKDREYALEGFDFYIFEGAMPERLPTDGVVLLVDPDSSPAGAGIRVHSYYDLRSPTTFMAENPEHPVLRNVIAENIFVTRYTVGEYDPAFETLLTCDTHPVLLVRNDGANKVAVMPFSVHYSNIVETPEWIFLLINLFNFYLPATVDANALEIGETVTVNSRGPEAWLDDAEEPITEFPAQLSFRAPGTYRLRQTSYFGKDLPVVSVFVKIPALESDIWHVEDSLEEPYVETEAENSYRDLLVWLAAALVALLFAEWWLQSRENK